MLLSVAASTLVLRLWLIFVVSCTNLPSSFSSHSRMDSMKRVTVKGGIGVGITHSLKLLGNRLLSRCVSETEGSLVGVRSVDIFFVGHKVKSSPKNVYGFVDPFGVDGGVETFMMTPTHLFVLHMVDVVAKIETDYVVISKLVLEGHGYGFLGLLLGGDY